MQPKLLVLAFFLVFNSSRLLAWGPEGHVIVGKLALQFVTPKVRANVLELLKGMPMDTAANWMDIMKRIKHRRGHRPVKKNAAQPICALECMPGLLIENTS